MDDPQPHQQEGGGKDGEKEDHGSDQKDVGGIVACYRGVMVTARHGGLQWTASVCYAFKKRLTGGVVL